MDLHLPSVLDAVSDGVYVVDRQRRIALWNASAERLSGFTRDEVIGRRCKDGLLEHCDDGGRILCGTACPLLATIRDGAPREARLYMRHADGHRHPVRVRSEALRDETGAIVGAVEVFDDDAPARTLAARAAEAERLACVDALTGIANRRALQAELSRRLAAFGRHGSPVGLLFADIDFFKTINDELGHDVGDQVLQMVARTLDYAARQTDVVGRWGGEEFLVVLPEVDGAGLAAAAERARALVGRSDFFHGRRRVGVTLSIGGTLAQPGDDAEALVRRADAFMYRAKDAGRDRVAVG